MQKPKKMTLAIETAIDGGSLSLLEGQTEIDFWIGTDGISKAEDILENISRLFEANKVTGENIGQILISSDVGSATGLKIGMATAKGLAKAFSSRLVAVSLIDSLIRVISPDKTAQAKEFVIALPVGKNNIFFRFFNSTEAAGDSFIVKAEEFFAKVQNLEITIYAHHKITAHISQLNYNEKVFNGIGQNMAKFLNPDMRLITKK